MPDKEFDNLIRNKFEDAEIEPSANLWANIEQQLAPKRKRVIPIYWMAAASVLIAITALLVFQKTEKIQLHGDDTVATVVTPTEQDAVIATTELPVATISVKENRLSPSVKKVQLIDRTPSENNTKIIFASVQPNTTTDRLLIKAADVKPLDVVEKEVPVENNAVVIAQVEPQKEDQVITETENNSERKGIRNVGDLVNFVVDKVDKREKKFLKFSTDDDDNSSLIGINIGFLKLNSRKHK
ncbi:hypothetical protein GM921_01045 [Pedobacter sp. LMG 31464]|uniref:Uncharacterized protein n=1 Tax=Pedobacter planticolens TaxID=2679964 RepID=A0A923ITU6_9SPHI|nr:hypothetical protein [Pedobacter planticolens]MBB2144058.1 hypothetical protein [Pedobacter planticolens]